MPRWRLGALTNLLPGGRSGLRLGVVAAVLLCACNSVFGVDDLRFDTPSTSGGGGAVSSAGGMGGDTPAGGSTSSGGSGPGGASGAGGGGGAGGGAGGVCGDSDLVACWPFDGDTLDHAGAHDATSASVSFVDGVDGQALYNDVFSSVRVPPHDDFGLSEVTIEAWVRPDVLPPSGSRMGVFDYNEHYGVYVTSSGVSCRITSGAGSGSNTAVSSGVPLVEDQWTHIACAASAAQVKIYVDGVIGANVLPSHGLNLALGSDDIAIGSNSPSGDILLGDLDNLRVFRTVRTDEEICEAAGRTPPCL